MTDASLPIFTVEVQKNGVHLIDDKQLGIPGDGDQRFLTISVQLMAVASI
jgi:hypothetical protein